MRARRVLSMGLAGLIAAALGAAPAQAGDTFFGTFTDNLSLPRATQQAEMDRQAATGIGTIREHVFWDRIEYAPRQYDFTRFDQLVEDAANRGLRIFPILSHPPAFYSSRPAGDTSGAQFPPRNPADMARFARAMVSRYGHNGTFWCSAGVCKPNYTPIRHWMVWNEPDYPAWWKGRPNALEYLPLLAAVSNAIRATDSDAIVVAGGLSRSAVAEGYLDLMLLFGGGNYFDAIGYHPYHSSVANVLGLVRSMRAKLNSYGLSYKGIYISEYGWSDGVPGTTYTTTACGAALLYETTKRLRSLRDSLRLAGITQFMWNDRVPIQRPSWPYYAGLVRVDGTPKPALEAFRAAIAGLPAPAGLTLQEACPPEQQGV